MGANGTSTKLAEIRRMADRFHRELESTSEPGLLRLGGNLFLGSHYAESNRIYFAPNPGDVGADKPFWTELETARNAPFEFPDKDRGEHRYWDNWRRLLDANGDLRAWFTDRVTSTFIVPWRTKGLRDLYRLNNRTSKRLFECAGRLVRKMIEHHEARLIIIAGKKTLYLLNDAMKLEWDGEFIEEPFERPRVKFGAKGIYEWRKRTLGSDPQITVLQIPHLARAGALHKLPEFASWLRSQLRAFGLEENAG